MFMLRSASVLVAAQPCMLSQYPSVFRKSQLSDQLCRQAKFAQAASACRTAAFPTRVLTVLASSAIEAESSLGESPAQTIADINKIDLRVGLIKSVKEHPEADELYVEEIDVGEAEPRIIISGLKKFVPIEELQERSVVVLCNLKPRSMRGIKSNGMLLCASNASHSAVEPLSPPEGAAVGERIYFGEDGAEQPAAATPNQVGKKKIWESVQPELKTDSGKIANFQGRQMLTSAGPVVAPTLANGTIS